MKIAAFRVRNYKRVEDTGWVSASDLTVLVGKNEAGKSAILRGLSKLNPSDGEEYDSLREFPRRRFSDEYDPEAPVASARFALSPQDVAALAAVSPPLAQVETVEVTRRYSNRYVIGFAPQPASGPVDAAAVRQALTAALDEFSELRAGRARRGVRTAQAGPRAGGAGSRPVPAGRRRRRARRAAVAAGVGHGPDH